MDDKGVVDRFVAFLAGRGHSGIVVERRPDEINRTMPDIDAIAGPFAIEHTSIDTVPDQRRDDSRFKQVVGGLEDELSNSFGFYLKVSVDYDAVAKGQNWSEIRDFLKDWLITEAEHLSDGKQDHDGIRGVPFRVTTFKSSDRRPGLFFYRGEPRDDTLPDRKKTALVRKAEKLANYRVQGKTTVILVESGDIALMNQKKMLDATRRAFPNGTPTNVDQVWYADTSTSSDLRFSDFTPAMDRDKRTSPRGLARDAREFFKAAEGADEALTSRRNESSSVNRNRDLFRAPPRPVRFLLAHSIELGLKAYLRHSGYSVDDLSKNVRHNLAKGWGLATECGIESIVTLEHDELEALRLISEEHASTQTRYIRTGIKQHDRRGVLMALAKKLLDAICPTVGYR